MGIPLLLLGGLALGWLLAGWLIGGWRVPPAHAFACPDGMVAIPAGSYRIGAGGQRPEEGPPALVRLSPFCLATHEVTNRQFAAFVEATGYRTVAERPLSREQFPTLSVAERAPGSLVFRPLDPGEPIGPMAGWHWVPGADWRHPEGPGSSIEHLLDHPVVQVAYEDAEAYAAWRGADLPSEAQWEFAARGGLRDQVFGWGDTWDANRANTWQGPFPYRDSAEDGHAGTAPVGSYAPNGYGLHDTTGNVWEWTADWFAPGHQLLVDRPDPRLDDAAASSDPREPGVAKHVIKGGSFLCSPSYCSRYRPAAREAESPDTGTSHIGIRLASQPLNASL
ncbi:conserved domain protein [Cyanobium sp. PCC 7001]|uniref:formylglycine-generating enzyme family protein n=1 Tax=Cyanobium sp. PCC 7001 TaxID=180281 RepID=UPI0001804B45|nr:formylglycine-generating enzyme family protein [Cyanobium sp. PCC 7001]EDY38422.1 conserved domain protein [Cyanobium sp. PCC 7001]